MLKKYKILPLIIEKDLSEQNLLINALKNGGVNPRSIYTAKNVAEGLDILSKKKVNVVLFGLPLTIKNIDLLKALETFISKLALIVLTPKKNCTQAFIQSMAAYGVQDYLIKSDIDEKLLIKSMLYSIDRVHNLETIHLSQKRYDFISKATTDMVWDWDLLAGKVYRNKEGWNKIYKDEGNESEFSSQVDWYKRVHPEDEEKLKLLHNYLYGSASRKNFKMQLRAMRNDGQYAFVEVKGHILRNNEGLPLRIIGSTIDMTEQKKAEEELKKLSLIAQETVNGVIITDQNEKIQWVNNAFTRLTEYTFKEVIGKTPGELLQGDETDVSTKKYMSECIKNQQPFECAIINYSKTGRKRWIKIQNQPIFDNAGKLKYFFAIETDITEIKQTEEILKASEAQYRYLFNNNPACIIIWDIESFRILEVNDTAVHQYNYTREQFLKCTVLDLRLREDYPRIKELAGRARSRINLKETAVWKHITKNGEKLYMDITSHVITYKGKPAILALANNITDRILLEEKLERERIKKQHEITEAVIIAQERERHTIGTELHDNVNQILAGSRLYISILKKSIGKNQPLIEETDKLIYSAIQEIRNLSHALVPPVLNYSELIEALENIIEITTKSGELSIKKDLKRFDNNAIPEKLKLSIYRIVQEQFNNIIKYANAKSIDLKLKNLGKKVFLSIKDDGIGFDTTKVSPGVGLMNIQTRASLFKGEMKIISAPGKGCELLVSFL